MVWQWTSGQLLAALSSTPELVFSDFTFIKRDQMLLAHPHSPHGPSLSVVHLICGEPYSTSTDHLIALKRHFSQQAILRLPTPPVCADQCLDIPAIKIINDPTPCPPHPAIPQNSPVPLFAPDPSQESAMVALSIPVVLRTPQRGPAPTMHHTLLVRASTFSSFCPSTAGQPVRPIPYDEWSVRDVHWVFGPPGFLHGQRYARTTIDDRWTSVEIYDFNPCHVPAPVSGWQALMKIGRQPSSPPITPKMGNFKTKSSTGCAHKNYLDCENLKSNMRYKKQTMRADFGEQKSGCALDCERVIVLDTERGGHVLGFTSYNV
ncbi:hypothetical protein FRC10_006895 [Ceratobasidium sp. 414]|nr:hypothetical protein FRC10_006895 [Ceratobasidium sp. 414]